MKTPTDTFKALQQEWYQRLEAAGFKDAEAVIDGEHVLKRPSDQIEHQALLSAVELAANERYYQILTQKVFAESFKSEVDRLILTMFAEGAKIKHIVEELARRGASRCRNTVTFRIRRYEMKWGLREYTLKQLNKKPPP